MEEDISNKYSILIAPMVFIMLTVIGWPLIRTILMSFTNEGLMNLDPVKIVGIENYTNAFQNKDFLSSLKISGIFAFAVVTSEMILGTTVGLLVNQPFKGQKIVRALLIVPWALPTVVNAMMWKLIYNPEYGALNSMLYQMNIIPNYVSWLSTPSKTLGAIIFADVWKNFSLVSMIVLASLQSIPGHQIEAAKIDGANAIQRFRYVTLPHILPSLQVALVLRIIEAVKVFDIIYIMTKGGPANKTRSGTIFIYQEAFTNSRLGSGATYAVLLVFFILIIIMIYMKLLKKKDN
ncbi:MAG: sugar ABC transporter permease [Spirochaetaceae bacterium]|nr:sugar ABC transporter permease [Spirochaetaceae bacterium]